MWGRQWCQFISCDYKAYGDYMDLVNKSDVRERPLNFIVVLINNTLSICLFATAESVTLTVHDGFFPYQLTKMITTMTWCVVMPFECRCISSRLFSHHFVTKLLKYRHIFSVHSTVHKVLHGCFPYLAKWSQPGVELSCAVIFYFGKCLYCPSTMTLPKKTLLKYHTSGSVRSVTSAVLNSLAPGTF